MIYSRNELNTILLEEWGYRDLCDSTSIIVPDGCRDIIVKQNTNGYTSFFISPLSSCSYDVEITAGIQFQGFRLMPGTTINEASLMMFMQNNRSLNELDRVWLENFCLMKPSVYEALEGLRSDLESINAVSKNLGVSIRTLQRYIKSETGMSPYFWRSLVRARRCARTLGEKPTLTDAALSSGYSDQSHMTRELKQWFNCTPSALQNGNLQTEVHLSGYD